MRQLAKRPDMALCVAGRPVALLRGRSLLCRLLAAIVAGGCADREALFCEVWAQRYRPPSSDNALYVAVFRLREALRGSGVVIEATPEGSYVARSGGRLALRQMDSLPQPQHGSVCDKPGRAREGGGHWPAHQAEPQMRAWAMALSGALVG